MAVKDCTSERFERQKLFAIPMSIKKLDKLNFDM